MGYRRFTDDEGTSWEVRDRSDSEWELAAVSRSSETVVRVPAPGYQKDPFEVSVEELKRLLIGHRPASDAPPRQKKNPFVD